MKERKRQNRDLGVSDNFSWGAAKTILAMFDFGQFLWNIHFWELSVWLGKGKTFYELFTCIFITYGSCWRVHIKLFLCWALWGSTCKSMQTFLGNEQTQHESSCCSSEHCSFHTESRWRDSLAHCRFGECISIRRCDQDLKHWKIYHSKDELMETTTYRMFFFNCSPPP